MNWAWAQQLAPTRKLVLMALADAADEHGVCWPSVQTLARKCTVSPRTVRRVMKTLIDDNLLVTEARFRADGSCASNRYRLQMVGGDKLSPSPDIRVTAPRHACHGRPDTGVTPRTTIRTVTESSPLPRARAAEAVSAAAASMQVDECQDALVFPGGLSECEKAAAYAKLVTIPSALAQQLLDELAARMNAGAIRSAPLSYLRGLIKRARCGAFTPEAGWRVALARERKSQNEEIARRSAVAVAHTDSQSVRSDSDPLVQRLRAIRSKARERDSSH